MSMGKLFQLKQVIFLQNKRSMLLEGVRNWGRGITGTDEAYLLNEAFNRWFSTGCDFEPCPLQGIFRIVTAGAGGVTLNRQGLRMLLNRNPQDGPHPEERSGPKC